MPTKTGHATIGPSADSSARPWFAESRCAYQQVDPEVGEEATGTAVILIYRAGAQSGRKRLDTGVKNFAE